MRLTSCVPLPFCALSVFAPPALLAGPQDTHAPSCGSKVEGFLCALSLGLPASSRGRLGSTLKAAGEAFPLYGKGVTAEAVSESPPPLPCLPRDGGSSSEAWMRALLQLLACLFARQFDSPMSAVEANECREVRAKRHVAELSMFTGESTTLMAIAFNALTGNGFRMYQVRLSGRRSTHIRAHSRVPCASLNGMHTSYFVVS